jgi:type I restriction enzyme S subunit
MSKDDTKHALVPRLRFPEFRKSPAWRKKSLSEIGTISKGKSLSKADLSVAGASPCIRYAELYTHYGEVITEVISRTDVPASELFLSEAGDVIIPASGETKADIATAACVEQAGVALGSDLNVVRSNLHGAFFSYLLNGSKKREIAKVAQGDTVAHLYPSQLSQVQIEFPNSAEQRKIADCLGSLDELIAAEGRKLKALRVHKQGLMQQLFPREGETRPRLRFPEFCDDTPNFKHVADFAKVTTGKKDTQNKVPEGRYPFFVRSQNVERIDSFSYDGEAILTSGDGVGVGENYHYIHGRFDFHQRVYCIYDFGECSYGKFVFYYFALHFNRRVKQMSAKNSVDSVRMGMITEMPIWLPRITEQRKIANILSSLDDALGTQADKLGNLLAHKRALMQQLFPSPECYQ